ncbi:MAG: TlpA family protein disulfide reductase [Saprospiraceae bacterium]|nr:TlpA family protein disulfide reductase [Saprospiraceae bacterium]
MKNIRILLLTSFLLPLVSLSGQDVHQVVQQYKNALSKIQSIDCKVEQLDTFVSGHVWHYHGELSMLRNQSDSLFGFQFKASKSVGGEALYDGLSEFQIDHKEKSYELNTMPQSYIVGSPGGQLVVSELMQYQDETNTPELLQDEQYHILRYQYPDLEEYDVRQREKKIFLDKATFLPAKVIERQVSLDKKQVITRIISDLRLNAVEHQQAFVKNFLEDYELVIEESDANIHDDLLQTDVKDFQLETFAGQYISTRPQDSKVLLLDFWEVWCGPCVQSMPKVQALANKYESEGLDVVGVLMDKHSQKSAEKMLGKKGIEFKQTFGSQDLREYFRVLGIPQYVLIDQAGKIRKIYQGYHDEIEDQIQTLLAEAK